jgi:hypothetical protein
MRWVLKICSVETTLLAFQCAMSAQSTGTTESLTACKLYTSPSAYKGMMVRIRDVYLGSFEGSYLSDIKCHKGMWFTTPDGNPGMNVAVISRRGQDPKVAGANFSLVADQEYAKFTQFAYATVENLEPAYKVTATFKGRLDRGKNFKLGKDGFGNGFGQMGQSEYQLILQSVSEVTVEEAPPFGPEPILSILPDHISNDH